MVETVRRLLAQGRGCGVHVILATHHALVSVFKDSSTSRNFVGRLALKVIGAEASRVAVGESKPRADFLLGCGDTYAIVPGSPVQRLQGAFVDKKNFAALPSGSPTFDEWPVGEVEDLGQELPNRELTGEEVGVSLIAAHQDRGRPTVQQMVKEVTGQGVGSGRAKWLMDLGREALRFMNGRGYRLCEGDK